MDRYRDLYRAPASLGFYGSSPYYDTDRRSAYSLPAVDPMYSSSYARVPVDAHAGYSVPDLLLPQRYSAPVQSRRRPRRAETVATASLGPRKRPFKKTKNNAPAAKQTPNKSSQQRTSSQKVTEKPSPGGKPSAATLAEETRELHRLFRTGVDRANGNKAKTTLVNNDEGRADKGGQKRKADPQKKEEKPSSAKKKQKGKAVSQRKDEEPSSAKKKKKQQKGKKKKSTKAENIALETSASKQTSTVNQHSLTPAEREADLELQTTACNSVREFLGISEAKNVDVQDASKDLEKIEDVEVEKTDANPAEDPKPTSPTSEEGKVLQEQVYNFFTKLFQDNQDLRKMYLDRKDAGTFECLVCSSVSSESKKFTNLTNLVMHTSMRRKNRPEHSGYGLAICDIFGWEPLRGPKRPVKQAKDNGGESAAGQPEKPDENAETLPEKEPGKTTETAKPPEEKTEEGTEAEEGREAEEEEAEEGTEAEGLEEEETFEVVTAV